MNEDAISMVQKKAVDYMKKTFIHKSEKFVIEVNNDNLTITTKRPSWALFGKK